MVRTILLVLALLIATLYLPFWVQVVLYLAAVVAVKYPLSLYIPAVVADALYAPGGTFGIGELKVTLMVSVILIIHWLVITKTRLATLYGLEQK